MEKKEDKTILYIVSDVRSGSTLLENILSKSDEIISVGELHHLGSYINKGHIGKTIDWVCSCKNTLSNCDFWSNVLVDFDFNTIKEVQVTEFNVKKDLDAKEQKLNKKRLELLTAVFQKIFNSYNYKTIVDSSKRPEHCVALYNSLKSAEVNFKVIYLKRDLRAIAISKSKWLSKLGKPNVKLIRLLLSTYIYRRKCNKLMKNIASKDIYEVNYSDLVKNTQYYLDEFAMFFKFKGFQAPEYMEIQNDHTIGGTPNKFFKRKIKLDNDWRQKARNSFVFNALGVILNRVS